MRFLSRDKEFYRKFFAMVSFIALQNVIICAVNLADNVMLGAYSEDALSGAALVNQIQFLLQMVINGVGEGIVVLASQYWGQKQIQPIKKVMNIGLYIGVATGALFTLVTFLFPRQSLALLTSDVGVIEEGIRYLRVICWSYAFFSFTTVMLSALRSVEDVRIGVVISMSTLLINICLNYVLIFGHFGFPRLGSAGAAIATLVSRMIEFCIVLVYVGCREKKLRIRFREFFLLDRELSRDYVRVAMPVILSGATWGIAMGVQTAILGHMGGSAIAANSIASSVFSVVSVMAYGGASAAGVIAGKTVGLGDMDKLKEYTRTLQVLFLLIGLASGAILYALKDLIIGFYAVSAEAKTLSDQFIMVLSVTLVGTSYQVACLTGIVRGGGHTKFVLFNDLIFMWLLVLPSSALCAFVWQTSPLIVFICLKSDQILKCFVAVFEVNSYRWVRRLTRKIPEDELLLQAEQSS